MQKISDWLPVVLIFGGLVLTWAGLDPKILTMNIGFAAYGMLGLADSIKRKYYNQFSVRLLKIVIQIIIAFLAVSNIIGTSGNFLTLLILVLMDKLILTPYRIESNEESKQD